MLSGWTRSPTDIPSDELGSGLQSCSTSSDNRAPNSSGVQHESKEGQTSEHNGTDQADEDEDDANSTIKMRELEVVDWLGKGAVGKVYLVRHIETQQL